LVVVPALQTLFVGRGGHEPQPSPETDAGEVGLAEAET
jgi:hypothetical protein